ncbi:ATP-binding cassette domain-containing protein [Candidatus Berkiella aquae]|uniref:ABC transporter ATP-binding protein n=1 Tax=Candidatus Berkiella aquae TaxID=295108 RepID=A0A0Q9YD04_9GAMM|nr:ABC transporter ATP-binding protein [Candidatus Berkiella aquae]MCS5709905.1 ABC transporter ATP-binding protein [Candidatus Berkiella aquae]
MSNTSQNHASAILSITNLNKTYASGLHALKNIHLEINKGEIFALLGPNGAGKTTLISIICGIVNRTNGDIYVKGYDILADYRKTRSLIGLVPQEIATESFETVWDTVNHSRSLFGKPRNPEYIEKLLKSLFLWEKRKEKIMTLSGGMKRRLMIAKALAHEPEILFLDEPTAGVDVELRRALWGLVHQLKASGVTIILTTHYIEEAEEMADRIGIIHQGELVLTDEKKQLMKKLGKKQLHLQLKHALTIIPEGLSSFNLKLMDEGLTLMYTFDAQKNDNHIVELINSLNAQGIHFYDLSTTQTSLEDIFVQITSET